MKRVLAIGLSAGLGAAVLAGGAFAQMPPGGPQSQGEAGKHDGGEMMGWHHHHRGMMMMMGTHFHFRKGDSDVDIACSNRDSLQDCVSAATTLIDKLNGAAAPAKPPQ